MNFSYQSFALLCFLIISYSDKPIFCVNNNQSCDCKNYILITNLSLNDRAHITAAALNLMFHQIMISSQLDASDNNIVYISEDRS